MLFVDFVRTLNGVNGSFTLRPQFLVDSGEIAALYGPSGAGKTSILRCLAGLDCPESGRITLNAKDYFDSAKGIKVPPQHRSVGMMFQDYALFPNMDVTEQLRYALPKGKSEKVVGVWMEKLNITGFANKKPNQLSGGQKQRVALARAFIAEPTLLLLDEPLSALDSQMRITLQDEILRLHREQGMTIVMVSHDVGEVYKMAQKVLLIEGGTITANGTPEQIFTHSMSSGKFKFTGTLLAKVPSDIMVKLTVLVEQQIVSVMVMPQEAQALNLGDKLLLVSKAFNPIVYKL